MKTPHNYQKFIPINLLRYYQTIKNIFRQDTRVNSHKTRLRYKYYISPKRNSRVVPQISLSGLWLKEAGFQIGDIVTIKIKKNCLVILKSKQQNH